MGSSQITVHALAEEALSLVDTGSEPAVIFTGHLMPGMSGARLARELRIRRARLPMLIVSGYAEAGGIDSDIPRLTKSFRDADLPENRSTLGSCELTHLTRIALG